MKNTVLGIIGLLLLNCGNLYSEEAVANNKPKGEVSINILSTPDLFNLTYMLAGKYNDLNPGVKINVINSELVNKVSFEGTGASSGFTSGDKLTDPDLESLWKMTIGREVIVPVTNSNNPFLKEIYRQGITPEKFARVFENDDKRVWSSLISEGKDVPVHLYIINDETVMTAVKKFLNIDQIPANVIRTASEKEMISAIQNDPYALGFCRLAGITGPDKQSMVENVILLPVDKNGNGKIDYSEQIYNDPQVFARGVWIGKYPKTLSTDLYIVASAQPENEAEIAFIKWMLTDGQQFLYVSGISDLVYSERQSKLDRLNPVNIVLPSQETYSFPKLAVIGLSVIIILSLIISTIIYFRRNKKGSVLPGKASSHVAFNENSVIVPKGLYYDKTHTWAFMEKNGMVRIGIDDFIQHVTGAVSRIELKMPGEKIKKGDIVLSIIQKGKLLNISAPVSGLIKEQNKLLLTDPLNINSSPYSEGWVYLIEPSNWLREIQFFDMAEKYRMWLQSEISRLKDFLATSLKVNRAEYENVVLQDGGTLKEGILEDLGPEVWEDFQTNFLDANK